MLVGAGILAAPMAELEARWRSTVAPVLATLGLPALPSDTALRRTAGPVTATAFVRLWSEFTMVRRSDPGATW